MLALLDSIIIMPLRILLELIFTVTYRMFRSSGLSIIAVSVFVNLLVWPLYKRSDAIQDEERKKQKQMSKWISHIRKTFHGDERFMMLSAYYKEQNYQPVSAVKGSLSLLLQIPFFLAAYSFLSSLPLLEGEAFGLLSDLSKPDALLHFGSLSIHLLPILMTVINLLSGAIYTKGLPLKDKLQVYLLGLFFFIFLYRCPSGLVFYWTLNNAFSLCRNLLMKYVAKHKVMHSGRLVKQCLPKQESVEEKTEKQAETILFLLGMCSLIVLIGAMIPMSVIQSSPSEFIDFNSYRNPLMYMVSTIVLSCGVFLVWGGVLYAFVNSKVKRGINNAICVILLCFTVNYMFFSENFGFLSPRLKFASVPYYLPEDCIINAVINLLIVWIAIMVGTNRSLNKYRNRCLKSVYLLFLFCGICLVTVGCFKVSNTISDLKAVSEKEKEESREGILHLSRNGKNVVIIMLDRAIGAYVPFILSEKPELCENYSGFTYYPNTISFGRVTNFASPALYGGYEYTPVMINKRTEESLKDKQNEALKVLPVLFSENDYHVTVVDPPYANYQWVSDLSIYDDYENIDAYHCGFGQCLPLLSDEEKTLLHPERINRNFFFYGIFRVSPLLFQPDIYDNGNYCSAAMNGKTADFMAYYAGLKYLDKQTEIDDSTQNEFIFYQNSVTHNPVILSQPDYQPTDDPFSFNAEEPKEVDGRTMKLEIENQRSHYDVNMSAFLMIADWLTYLKENEVYDNTRIIIVSDHGKLLQQFDDMEMKGFDIAAVNPLLLVKDFASEGPLKTDMTFMTNADVPTIAVDQLIAGACNPFTGKAIESSEKNLHTQYISTSVNWRTGEDCGNILNTDDSIWFSVQDNIFNDNNWIRYDTDFDPNNMNQ